MNQQYKIRIVGAQAQLQEQAGAAIHEVAAGQVLLQVKAASLNYRDLLTLQGAANGAARDGLVPLSDAVGTVLAVGDGVQGWQVGDRASPNFFPAWVDGRFDPAHLQLALGGGNTDGVLSQQLLVPAQSLVAPAAHLTDEEAATLPCAGLTAWHALFERGQVRAGETVLVQGTGGVALLGLQLAAAAGARVIVTSSSHAKLERARQLGAWVTIHYGDNPDWDQQVLALTEGLGADHILELGGPDTYDRSIRAVAAGGRIAQIGVLSGFNARPDIQPLQFKNARIDGICVGSVAQFQRLNQFMAEHRIRPVIDRVFDFDASPAAYTHLASGQHFGKVAIRL
ncbi:NAD(P)-dependent alcohol dehydrogenase [Mitsuaria sp. WAJ17]|uniref:zinc-dependent alcohol dehydrogenase family protein n=1 Tax=Mitsuaria sp. WAJ17 TaxID=2761452 RepID=UPI0016008558|nr:NAD(P)-dependent alcohol dehydrogenase [Mitsuaria sp. WAJ17]MBB2487520.1 NAD(P)-dependent alcohol dehydrogenase [Mitsuaria sp. WAJ17]